MYLFNIDYMNLLKAFINNVSYYLYLPINILFYIFIIIIIMIYQLIKVILRIYLKRLTLKIKDEVNKDNDL